MKIVSSEMLIKLGVCQDHVDYYENITGKEFEITEKSVDDYYYYPWVWMGRALLYDKAAEEFLRVMKILIEEHRVAVKDIKDIKEREPYRITLRKNIGLLFYKLYNEIYVYKDEEVI